ncbi:uncharacterized protein LOC119269182 [Triticum dicoccoides]|uniref:uncharacterized protein LOC119269182 n=1 Tax=Triticum dicoccoides TaxID=85692 RepID=UPI00188ED685|nr:uncharacterized protein LOC119269182 [Triticum dicoccoides]
MPPPQGPDYRPMSPAKPSFRGPTPTAGVRCLGLVTSGRRIPPACVPHLRISISPWIASSSGLNFFSSLRPATLAVLVEVPRLPCASPLPLVTSGSPTSCLRKKNGHIILLGTDVHVASVIASSSSIPSLQSNDSRCNRSPLFCEVQVHHASLT